MVNAPAAHRPPLRIDFVSDVTCPWCAIGLRELQTAIERLADRLRIDLHLQPFELNPDIPPEGEPIADYARRKYGVGPAELATRQALIRARGAASGLALRERSHVYNTFDAHRLLHWAALHGRALELKRVLLAAYHERGENPARQDVLLDAAVAAQLPLAGARALLAGDIFASEVRATVQRWQQLGITSVPSIVIEGRQLIQGGQRAEVFEQILLGMTASPQRPECATA